MTQHTKGNRKDWLAARVALLAEEKELTRRSDEVARHRAALPWVALDKDYRFATESGPASLADLFGGRSQLIVSHFMFGPDYAAGCPSCSAIADGFNGTDVHLRHHDVAFWAVSRAPLAKLLAFRERMGWSFPWASSNGSDFNFDFGVSFSRNSNWTASNIITTVSHPFLQLRSAMRAFPAETRPMAHQKPPPRRGPTLQPIFVNARA